MENTVVTRVGHLLLRILRMWLVRQLLINRHQISEGNLDRRIGKGITLKQKNTRRSLKIHEHFHVTSFPNYICRLQLKALFFGVHN